MAFVANSCQQLSLFDQLAFLPMKKLKMLEKSWAKTFSDHVFTRINEHIFAPLYSDRSNSRPNSPVNVLVGALILKDHNGLTDEELIASCEFDFRFQYALHTTSFEDQPVSERSLSRFRSRLAAYELTTGEDLLHKCFTEISEDMREYMELSPTLKRMDSMMIESNIRKMGRLELLYTCLSNIVKLLAKDGKDEFLDGLEHYAEPDDRNRVIYHNKDIPLTNRLQKVIDDAVKLLPKCRDEYADTEDFQLLERAIREQTRKDDNGDSIWSMSNFDRGEAFRDKYGANLPKTFPVIDAVDGGEVTAIRSIDLTSPYYQDVSNIEKKIKDDIRSLKGFGPRSATINGKKYEVTRVDSRHLKVIIPENSGQIGRETVENLKGYAFVQGVILEICEYETSERYRT
jgi:hypothetical protein